MRALFVPVCWISHLVGYLGGAGAQRPGDIRCLAAQRQACVLLWRVGAQVGEPITTKVDYARRSSIVPNHTFTHVLNYGLRCAARVGASFARTPLCGGFPSPAAFTQGPA